MRSASGWIRGAVKEKDKEEEEGEAEVISSKDPTSKAFYV
jgi:hypothetical protein